MKYAVIRTGGKQYKVKEGDTIEVERLVAAPDSEVAFSDVLLIAGDATPVIGTPLIAKTQVVAKVLGEVKGEKIRVAKYKAKVRYRRTTGHRQLLTKVQIKSIGGASKEKVVSEEKIKAKTTVKNKVQ